MHLSANPEARQRVIDDPTLLPEALEEVLRLEGGSRLGAGAPRHRRRSREGPLRELSVSLDDVLAACDRLRAVGMKPLSFFGTETTEPSVIGWMPAAAVYFRDPDGHQLEYLAMLDEPPRAEDGIVPWSEWMRLRPARTAGPSPRPDRQSPVR